MIVGRSRSSIVPSTDRLEARRLVELGGAADVEGPHRQLGARLADRLGGDDADRLADIDRRAAGEIAPVAFAADAMLALADQRRADVAPTGCRSRRSRSAAASSISSPSLAMHVAGLGVDHVLGRGTAEDALAQRGDDRAALDDRAHVEAVLGAAILLDDHAILADVDETAGQIARVRRLERGVREALAGAVGRVEIFKDGQAFLEVRDDRRLDDLARRLGHQAAHAGELLHLRLRTAGARMGHHVDRVDRRHPAVLVLRLRLDLLHHGVGDLVAAAAPGVDHLVVLLLLGDQAVLILLLVILHERAGLVDQPLLLVRDDHVVLAEADAGLEGVAEAERHDRVGEQHRLLLAGVAIDVVDDVADLLLGEEAVDGLERHLVALRQRLAEQHAARRRLEALHVGACRPRRSAGRG